MRDIWITTDTHFNHQMLIDRGFRPPDFEQRILNGLTEIDQNRTEDALLVHLGDVCMGEDAKSHERFFDALLHPDGDARVSTAVLVKGNHDRKSDSWYYDQGWDFVCHTFSLRKYGKTIVFSHRPLNHRIWGEYADLNLHGHTHATNHRDPEVSPYYKIGFNIELALEAHKYRPWKFGPRLIGVEP